MGDFDQIRGQLLAQLEDLRKRQAKVEGDLRRSQHPDFEEQAQEAENDEVLTDLEAHDRGEIARIERAIAAIDAGSYGTCAACGGLIAPRRLQALPFATECIDCAA